MSKLAGHSMTLPKTKMSQTPQNENWLDKRISMIQLGANRSSQKAVNGQESLLFMGNPDYVASSVEFPKVPIIDLNNV